MSRILEDRYRIEFPAEVALGKMPKGVTYIESGIQYRSSYELFGHSVMVRRELEIQHPSDVCTPQDKRRGRDSEGHLHSDASDSTRADSSGIPEF